MKLESIRLAWFALVAMICGSLAIGAHSCAMRDPDDVSILATPHAPAIIVGGRPSNLPAGDGLVWDGQGGSLQIGPVVPTTSEMAAISSSASTNTGMFDTYSSDVGHVGTAGNNELIHFIARNSTTFNTTANAGHAAIMDAITNCGESAGANGVTCTTLAPNATCSTGDCTAYAYNSQFGIMQHDGAVLMGGPVGTSVVQLGNRVKRFTVLDASPTTIQPQLDLGIVAPVDGYNMHIKNTATGVAAMGIALQGDTTVAASVAPQIVLGRGAGGALTNFGLLCSDNGAASCLAAAAANDIVLANYGTAGSLWLADKGTIHFGSTTTDFTDLTINGHWVQNTNTGVPTLSAACNGGGAATIVGNDNRYEVTTGTGSVACVITFVHTWTQKPVCQITTEGGIALPTYTVSATAVTMTVNLAGVYNVACMGQPGST